MGLLCAFGWSTLGLNIGTLLSISIGLVLRSALKNWIDGNPDNIHIRFNTEGHRVESRGTKGMVRLRSDLTGSFRPKECFDFFCDFDASLDGGVAPG